MRSARAASPMHERAEVGNAHGYSINLRIESTMMAQRADGRLQKTGSMGSELYRDSIAMAYARWAPVYDLVFGAVFARGRRAAITAAERIGGRILEVGVGTGISLPHYRRASGI